MMMIIIHNTDDSNNGNLNDKSDLQSDDSCYHISFILVSSVVMGSLTSMAHVIILFSFAILILNTCYRIPSH